MTALHQVQTALYQKLTGDATLAGMITGVFDFRALPKGQPFPYITLGDSTETDDSALQTIGYDTTFTLHIWSTASGTFECQAILAQLNKLLNQKPLALESQQHGGTWYEFSQPLGDPNDDTITHLPVRYRIQVQE